MSRILSHACIHRYTVDLSSLPLFIHPPLLFTIQSISPDPNSSPLQISHLSQLQNLKDVLPKPRPPVPRPRASSLSTKRRAVLRPRRLVRLIRQHSERCQEPARSMPSPHVDHNPVTNFRQNLASNQKGPL